MKHIYSLLFLVFSCICAQAQSAVYSNAAPITINDNTTASIYSSNILVSGFTGSISDVGVVIKNFTHGSPSDVAICLEAPGGQKIVTQAGIWGAPASNITYMMSDLGSTRVGQFSLPASGTYKPTSNSTVISFNSPGPGSTFSNPGPANSGTATMASTFSSATPNGTWKLWIIDASNGDAGLVGGGWELRLNPNAVLPIELADFHTECETENIMTVNWTTHNEQNSEDFTIQTSADGSFFEDAKIVKAAGNSQVEITYKATLPMPYAETYVRLKLQDITGQLGFSSVREAKCGTDLPIVVRPNPIVENHVMIDNPKGELMKFELFDMNGKVVKKGISKAVHYRMEFETEMPKGLYLLHIQTDGEDLHFKLNNLR